MILDSTDIVPDQRVQADLCIVGAGVAGITLARELIDSGIDVVMLESGGLNPSPEMQSLNTGENVGLHYFDLDQTRTRAFGGTSHRWHLDIKDNVQGVRLRALDTIDFEQREWVPNSGWPFGKEHLDPYYERAHEICKIGPYSYDVEQWERPDTPQLSFQDNSKVKTTIFQFGRKDVFHDDYRKEIENAKNITAYLNATVLKVNTTDNAKQVNSVSVATSNDTRFTVEARSYVLALGALETPRLLLLSDDVMKNGLGNQHDLVGRYFMEHPHLWSGIFYPSNPNTFDRADLYKVHRRNDVPIMGKLTLSEEVLRREKLLNFTTSLHHTPMISMKQAIQSFKIIGVGVKRGKIADDFGRHLKNVLSNLDAVGFGVLRNLLGKRNKWISSVFKYHGFHLNIMAEQVPNPESRILLDSERNKFGQRKIKLNWRVTEQDIDSIRRAEQIIDGELRRSNLGRLEIELDSNEPPPGLHGGRHLMGTTRMHVDPQKGVVDENSRIHGMQNVFIAGPSVFPTVGYANPTLTIVAMAARLSEHIKKIFN